MDKLTRIHCWLTRCLMKEIISICSRTRTHIRTHTQTHTHTHTHTNTHTHTKNTQETRNWFVFSPHTYRRCAVRRLVVWWRNPPLCVRARIARKSVSVTCMCVECQYVWHSKEIVKFGLWWTYWHSKHMLVQHTWINQCSDSEEISKWDVYVCWVPVRVIWEGNH